METFERKVLDDIARVGWSDIAVFPTEKEPPDQLVQIVSQPANPYAD